MTLAIEISPDQVARLIDLAARRRETHLSRLAREAIERYLQEFPPLGELTPCGCRGAEVHS